MTKLPSFALAACILAACSGNPFTPIIPVPEPVVPETPVVEDPDNGVEPPPAPPAPNPFAQIPEALSNNLEAASYDPVNDTLTLRLSTLNAQTLDASYIRTEELDRPGYQAYTLQDDPLDRHVTAMVAQSADDTVKAGVASDGGQFNTFFSGGFYERNGTYTQPTQGLVSYAGTYAGVTNIDAPGAQLLPITGTVPNINRPRQSAQTVGDVFLNVDFSSNVVNGSITGRNFPQILDTNGVPQELPTVILRSAGIDTDGRFSGNLVQYIGSDSPDIGEYGGIFGGENASSVAGVVALTEFDGEGNPLGYEGERETGVFVLAKCGTAQEDALRCADAR